MTGDTDAGALDADFGKDFFDYECEDDDEQNVDDWEPVCMPVFDQHETATSVILCPCCPVAPVVDGIVTPERRPSEWRATDKSTPLA